MSLLGFTISAIVAGCAWLAWRNRNEPLPDTSDDPWFQPYRAEPAQQLEEGREP